MPPGWMSDLNHEVYRQFPEFSGVKPRILNQGVNFLFVYQSEVHLAPDKRIQRIVRAVVDKDGKILKITTSR